MKRSAVHGVAVQVFLIFCWSRSEQWQQHLLLIGSIGGSSTITISARRLLTMIFPLSASILVSRWCCSNSETTCLTLSLLLLLTPASCKLWYNGFNKQVNQLKQCLRTELSSALVCFVHAVWKEYCDLLYHINESIINLPPWHICQDPTS